jgi:hypothetical protein
LFALTAFPNVSASHDIAEKRMQLAMSNNIQIKHNQQKIIYLPQITEHKVVSSSPHPEAAIKLTNLSGNKH